MKPRKEIITVEEIINIHDKLIKKYGGHPGILNISMLEFTVHWVNIHPRKPLLWKVAVLMRGIISGHPFVDGNKRTGLEVADTILDSRNYRFIVSEEEIKNFILELAMEEKEINEIVRWLKSSTKRLK